MVQLVLCLNPNKLDPIFLMNKMRNEKRKFIIEGFAVGNDLDLQNDIIPDTVLKRASKRLKGKDLRINHTEKKAGEISECHFKDGKIWIKAEVTKPSIIEKVKSGELNSLSIKGRAEYKRYTRVFSPELNLVLKVVTDLDLEEVSLVPQGANPEAKIIKWYYKL